MVRLRAAALLLAGGLLLAAVPAQHVRQGAKTKPDIPSSPQPQIDNQLPITKISKSETSLSPTCRRAYAEVLKFRLAPARQLLRTETGPGALLVADCADFVELLVSQDAARYPAVVAGQDTRLDALSAMPASALRDYTRAEIRLHLGINQLVFNHEIVGGLNLRQAFHQMQAVAQRYPSFAPARKTLGLCQFAVGALPEGYHWLLVLLGLSGDVDTGLRNLTLAASQAHDFQTESRIYLALIREGYYKQPAEALHLAQQLLAEQPDNLLFSYLCISLNKRQHHADAALAAYRARPTGPGYLPLAYLDHMVADLLLYQGDYTGSERRNLAFLAAYRGRHYRKDAAFKLYLAALLGGQPTALVTRYRQQINEAGPTDIEEDNYAQHFYHDALPLNQILTRARLQIDGGYCRAALTTLRQLRLPPAAPLRDRIEEPYRRARAYQGLARPDSAQLAFERTLAVSGSAAPYYFAPQAALELGYYAKAAGQLALARRYFEMCLHYPWHEYKNSTDAKANLALHGL